MLDRVGPRKNIEQGGVALADRKARGGEAGGEAASTPAGSGPGQVAFAGFRFPPEVITVAVRWYLRYGLSYRAAYLGGLEEVLPAARHVTERYSNNRIESDHGRLKARLLPMRRLKRLATAAVIAAGHDFVQNIPRGHTNSPSTSHQPSRGRQSRCDQVIRVCDTRMVVE